MNTSTLCWGVGRVDMEEFVGQLWHKLITRAAATDYPNAEVMLDQLAKPLAIQFRAFGGDPGLALLPASTSDWKSRRGLISRIATTDHKVELAWVDGESVRLPSRLAVFPDADDNRRLYLWLAALAANSSPRGGWLDSNQQAVLQTLARLPGLGKVYQQLVQAHLKLRPPIDKLHPSQKHDEERLRQALLKPGSTTGELDAPDKLFPVPLWLHPSAPQLAPVAAADDPLDDDEDAPAKGDAAEELAEKSRRKGERTEDIDGRDGLLAFRLESVLSWAEFMPVDRTADDDDPENAKHVVDDLDKLSLTRSKDAPASKLKFDLDLPAEAYDDGVLQSGILLPEWDYRQALLKPDRCSLQLMVPAHLGSPELPGHLRQRAKRVRAQFENLAQGRQWLRGQPEGSELDIDRYIMRRADIARGYHQKDDGLFHELRTNVRDLSCLLLADLSLSTDAWVSNEARVIDVIRDALHLFNEALSATRDRYAIGGFSSRRREHIRYYSLKGFDEPEADLTRQRINSLEPGYYTRMGAAIRYATGLLEKEPSSQRLLLLLSDGKPNDLDLYEGRYGVEDTRHAIHEAFDKGIRAFCVTVDEKANDYLPYIFGSQNFVVVRRAQELPAKLPQLYSQLSA